MKNSIINIAMTTDDNYAEITATSIASMIYRNPEELFNFWIVVDNVTDEKKKSIENVVKKSVGSNVYFIPFSKILEKYPLDQIIKHDIGWPLNTFTVLFLTEITSENRVIYVDDDTICMDSISELWNMQLNDGEIVAGCLDTCAQTEETKNYVSVGILLMDLKQWRELLCSEKAFAYLKECEGKVSFADQGVLNYVLKNKFRIIAPKYNAISPIFMLSRKAIINYWRMINYYSVDELREARDNPVFVHFTRFITVRPWEEDCIHPYADDFEKMWEYAELGELKKNRYLFPDEVKKIYNVLEHYPWFVYSMYRFIKIVLNKIKRMFIIKSC